MFSVRDDVIVHLRDWVGRKSAHWRRNEDGATAVEFGLIITPFMMLLIGTMSICLFYFTSFAVEDAVWKTSRDVRTGAFQQGLGPYAVAWAIDKPNAAGPNMIAAFKQQVCNHAPSYLDCTNSVRVLVQQQTAYGTPGFKSMTDPACTDAGGNLIPETAASASFDPGTSSAVVLITACVAWRFGGNLSFLTLSNMPGGARLIQASTALRTEPYGTAP